jgi:hypothetical protein
MVLPRPHRGRGCKNEVFARKKFRINAVLEVKKSAFV